jgi:hypothetical protein
MALITAAHRSFLPERCRCGGSACESGSAAVGTMDRDGRLRERVRRGLASGELFLIDHKLGPVAGAAGPAQTAL